MLHPDVDRFIRTAISRTLKPKAVLEFGSYAMHDHNPRPLFPGARYVGIDARPGPGVDLIGLAHDVEELLPGRRFDMVLSLQALEHDPYWESTIEAGVNALSDNGVIVVTCAGPLWVPHEYDTSPTPGYYYNVSIGEILAAITRSARMAGFEVVRTHSEYPDGFLKRSCVCVQLRKHKRTDGPLREEVRKKLTGVQSAVTIEQCEALYMLAVASCGPIVEIGAYLGRSTAALALGLKHAGRLNKHVTTIDPFKVWTGSGGTTFGPHLIPRFRQTISSFGLVPFVELRQEDSQTAEWDGKPIGLLFIDGDHTVEGVVADWMNWAPRIAPGGIVAFHDSDMDGPKKQLDLIRVKSLGETCIFKVIKEIGNLCIVKREI